MLSRFALMRIDHDGPERGMKGAVAGKVPRLRLG